MVNINVNVHVVGTINEDLLIPMPIYVPFMRLGQMNKLFHKLASAPDETIELVEKIASIPVEQLNAFEKIAAIPPEKLNLIKKIFD